MKYMNLILIEVSKNAEYYQFIIIQQNMHIVIQLICSCAAPFLL